LKASWVLMLLLVSGLATPGVRIQQHPQRD
jgi:hypothetical protein